MVRWTCYASDLGGCSANASKEHYISASLLRQLEPGTVEGAPGIPEDKVLGVDALGTKILCQRHNAALSDLDAEAGNLFAAILAHEARVASGAPLPDETVTFCGEFLERWLLKVGFGLVAAKRRCGIDARLRNEEKLLPVLFGSKDWPIGHGMYSTLRDGGQVAAPANVAIQTMVNADAPAEMMTVMVWQRFLPLTVALGKPDRSRYVYRPGEFHLSKKGEPGTTRLRFAWHDNRPHGDVVLERTGSMQGWAPLA